MKTMQMRTSRGYGFRTFYSKGVRHPALAFDKDSKAIGQVGKLCSSKVTRSHVCSYWRLLVWGSWSKQPTRSGTSYVIGLEGNVGVLWLVLSQKEKRMQKQLSVTHDRILTILGPLLQIVVWLPGLNMWIRVLLSHMVWPCLYIQPPRISVSHVRSPEGGIQGCCSHARKVTRNLALSTLLLCHSSACGFGSQGIHMLNSGHRNSAKG